MKETKFTKGNWTVEDGKVVVCEGFRVAYAYSGSNIPLTPKINANAHLISCAPDMYEMLEKVNQTHHDSDYEIEHSDLLCALYDDIESLLKRARGE